MCSCYCYILESTCTDCWVVEGEGFGEGDAIWGCVDLVYVSGCGGGRSMIVYIFLGFFGFLSAK